jgi:Mn-containing catalase
MLDHARMSQFYGLPEEEYLALLDDCSKESESHLKMVEQMVSYMENKRIGGV